jgi:hypothetical protein
LGADRPATAFANLVIRGCFATTAEPGTDVVAKTFWSIVVPVAGALVGTETGRRTGRLGNCARKEFSYNIIR